MGVQIFWRHRDTWSCKLTFSSLQCLSTQLHSHISQQYSQLFSPTACHLLSVYHKQHFHCHTVWVQPHSTGASTRYGCHSPQPSWLHSPWPSHQHWHSSDHISSRSCCRWQQKQLIFHEFGCLSWLAALSHQQQHWLRMMWLALGGWGCDRSTLAQIAMNLNVQPEIRLYLHPCCLPWPQPQISINSTAFRVRNFFPINFLSMLTPS